jgi:hypothetical protein
LLLHPFIPFWLSPFVDEEKSYTFELLSLLRWYFSIFDAALLNCCEIISNDIDYYHTNRSNNLVWTLAFIISRKIIVASDKHPVIVALCPTRNRGN